MKKTLVVGITGGSGSGKTTFIRKIRENLPEKAVCVLSQDEYYRPMEEQVRDENNIVNFDLPGAIDRDAFFEDIQKLIKGKKVKRPEYTFNNRDAKPKELIFKPAPILIIEGLFVFYYSEIRDMLDLRIFLHAKENIKVIRRIKRDRIERNYPLEDVLYRYENHVLPAFEKYIMPYKEDVDIIINNNLQFDMALQVITGFFKSHLRKMKKAKKKK